jgi:Protein of unknown function (DUF4232)
MTLGPAVRQNPSQPDPADHCLKGRNRVQRFPGGHTLSKENLDMKSQLRIALPVAAAAVGILLAGCGSSGTTAQSSGPPTSASSTPAAASSTPAATTSPASPTVTPSADSAAAPQCTAADLTIAYTDNSQIIKGALDGMSHADAVITFTNSSSSTCETAGYPGVAVLDAAGHQIKQAVRTAQAAPVIILHAGQTASALISGNTASCTKVTKAAGLLVTAPDQRTSTHLGSDGALCLNSVEIGTLQHGNAAGLKLG